MWKFTMRYSLVRYELIKDVCSNSSRLTHLRLSFVRLSEIDLFYQVLVVTGGVIKIQYYSKLGHY